jgi:hypothetical protein
MRWQHDTLRACTLDVGSGRGAIKVDVDGFVVELNDYAEHALAQWADAIGFKRVEDAPSAAPRRQRKRKRAE